MEVKRENHSFGETRAHIVYWHFMSDRWLIYGNMLSMYDEIFIEHDRYYTSGVLRNISSNESICVPGNNDILS